MSKIIEQLTKILTEKFNLEYSKKYKKAAMKYSNKPSNIKSLKNMTKELEETGKLSSSSLHSIRMPLYSEVAKKDIKGWKVAYVSKSDDLRLGYYKHDNGVIEVKFGTAKDLGYTH